MHLLVTNFTHQDAHRKKESGYGGRGGGGGKKKKKKKTLGTKRAIDPEQEGERTPAIWRQQERQLPVPIVSARRVVKC